MRTGCIFYLKSTFFCVIVKIRKKLCTGGTAMEETTTVVTEEESLSFNDIGGVLDILIQVFGFFRKIVDTLAGFIEPVFEDLFRSIL